MYVHAHMHARVVLPELLKYPLQASGNITAAGLLLLIFIVWAPLIATFMDRVEPILLRLFEDFPAIQHLVQGVPWQYWSVMPRKVRGWCRCGRANALRC